MSRDKHVKAPNIVAFIKRFNQVSLFFLPLFLYLLFYLFFKTTFWIQKEILVCKRLERRAKMITHFIKIAKVFIFCLLKCVCVTLFIFFF